jgi:hypothetical protein
MAQLQISALVNGTNVATSVARAYKVVPKTAPKVAGTLNGQPCEFMLTKGQGRGMVVMYCAYFVLDGQLYYFYTNGALAAGAQVTASAAAAAPVVEVPKVAAAPKVDAKPVGSKARAAARRSSAVKVTKVAA